jgi:O-antigen/teichoic acid export membrane protein
MKSFLSYPLLRSIFYTFLQALSAYGVTVLLARAIDEIEFGSYLLSFTWALILIQLIDLAFEQCFSSYKNSFYLDTKKLLQVVYFSKISMFLLVLFICLISHFVFLLEIPFFMLFFMIPILNPIVIFEIEGKFELLAKILLIEKLIFFILLCLYIYIWDMGIFVYILYAVISFLSLIYQFKILNLTLKRYIDSPISILKQYLQNYWPVYISLSSLVVIGIGSRLILEFKLGLIIFASVTLVFQLTNVINIIHSQIERNFRPQIAKFASQKDFVSIRFFIKNYFIYYITPLFLICFLIGQLSKIIILIIFGETWLIAANYLEILVYLMITTSLIKMTDVILVALRKVKFGLYLNFFTAILLSSFLLSLDNSSATLFLYTILGTSAIQAIALTMYTIVNLAEK